jgi:hypothetical protein
MEHQLAVGAWGHDVVLACSCAPSVPLLREVAVNLDRLQAVASAHLGASQPPPVGAR